MKYKGLFALREDLRERIYGPEEQQEIAELVALYAPPQTRESLAKDPSVLAECEVLISGWGAPMLDEKLLAHAPKLKAFFYGAGSVRGIVTDAVWGRGITVVSAWAANAVPVAEYTLAQIFMCLKCVWQHALAVKREKRFVPHMPCAGGYRSTVGIISLGMIGRRVCELLRAHDVRVIAYDPYWSAEQAAALGVTLCSLDEIFAQADVVSLHTPWLKETEQMIRGRHFAMMKQGASFINTARGAVVHEAEMIEELKKRPDILAVLDVTYPEPPAEGSPLYEMPNVVLTPHIAGSLGPECRRLGRYIVEELRRYCAGEPLRWALTREQAARMA